MTIMTVNGCCDEIVKFIGGQEGVVSDYQLSHFWDELCGGKAICSHRIVLGVLAYRGLVELGDGGDDAVAEILRGDKYQSNAQRKGNITLTCFGAEEYLALRCADVSLAEDEKVAV